MDDSPPPPEATPPPPPPVTTGSPTDFLKNVVGKRVVVRLTSGVDYREEHVNGSVTNRYGDAFIRGNNGPMAPLALLPC
ncbi:hypothetical protein BJV77DRAFT_1009726 [Russula vinacea]|nr:hypothetical protein BJV77DRAFT_1009726 [Russula vinacea]